MERLRGTSRKRSARCVVAAGSAIAALALPGVAHAADRGFELVTPADSRADIEVTAGFTTARGDLVVFNSGESLAGAAPNGPLPTLDSYTARLGPAGWSTEWVTDASDVPGTLGSRTYFTNADGSRQVFQTENNIDPLDTFAHSNDPHLRTRAADGSRTMTWLAPGARSAVDSRSAPAATADLRSILVSTPSVLTAEDTDNENDLYLVSDTGTRLVTPGTVGINTLVTVPTVRRAAFPGTLAADASYVYFTTWASVDPADVDTANDIYRWDEDGTVTLISVNRQTVPDPEVAVTALGFSADGDKACFFTRSRLVDDDTDSLDDTYCYVLSTDTLELVTGAASATATRGLAVSRDGSSVFFSTDSALVPEDLDGGQSVYVRRDGRTTYVSPLASSDTSGSRKAASSNISQRAFFTTADGTTAVFPTAAAAVPEDADGRMDVYRWTLEDGLERISGDDGPGVSQLGAAPTNFDNGFSENGISGRAMSDDGERVFFESTDALVPADTDGGFVDVYEWTADEGARLLSAPGEARYDSLYMDNSADGGNVFFVTAEPVLAQDVNAARDLYAAREGGGFPMPVVIPGCLGDACQGTPGTPPALPAPRTDAFQGAGDTEEPETADAQLRILQVSARERRRLARTGRGTIRIQASDGGVVGISATMRVRRKNVRVASAWRRVTARRTTGVRLTLSRSARAQLRRARRLRVTITAHYSDDDARSSRVVVLNARR